MCKGCGLLYLNPRPTARTYQKFYEEGGREDSLYHKRISFDTVEGLLKAYYGPDFVMDMQARKAMTKFMAERGIRPGRMSLCGEQGKAGYSRPQAEPSVKTEKAPKDREVHFYANVLYEELKEFVPVGGKVFEPGASWGKMLWPWKKLHGCEVSGVEPKTEAVLIAKRRFGIDLLQGFSDNPQIPKDSYDLVFNTRTINHMLDPLGDLQRAWRWIKPGGILFVDIQDVIEGAKYESFDRHIVQIDHPYMFSLATLKAMVQRAGFEIVRAEITDFQHDADWEDAPAKRKQIHIIGRKSTEPVTVEWPDPAAELAALLRRQLDYNYGRHTKAAAERSKTTTNAKAMAGRVLKKGKRLGGLAGGRLRHIASSVFKRATPR
jgi:SAM-dependent methyltransferase